MKTTHHLLTFGLLAFAGAVLAAPLLGEPRIETDPELTGGYFEGDIVLDERQRNGWKSKTHRWPNNKVFYKFGDHFDEDHTNHILRGMRIIEEVSCIRFFEADEEQTYFMNITNSDGGCFSTVGFYNDVQSYNLALYPLDSGCFRMATIVHELLHTLGFYHMQSVANRDDYVRIVAENIKAGKEINFNKYNDGRIDDFDEEYDYGSVLHYSAYAFSVNGEKTIVALNENEAAGLMGQRRGMSKSDINKLNVMYRCPMKQ